MLSRTLGSQISEEILSRSCTHGFSRLLPAHTSPSDGPIPLEKESHSTSLDTRDPPIRSADKPPSTQPTTNQPHDHPLHTPPCPPALYPPARLSPPMPGRLRKRPSRNQNSRKRPSLKTSVVSSRSCRRTRVRASPTSSPATAAGNLH